MPKKKAAAKKPKMTKAAIVRSMPNDTPRADVVAKAKEAGISLTEDYVSKIRTMDNAKAKKKGTSAKKTSSGPRGRGKAPDKKNRVLELVAANPSWSAEQVAKAAKCSTTYVYSVWRSKGSGKATNAGAKAVARTSSSNGAVSDFYRVLKRVGVDKAKELIANIEAYENA